MYYYFESDKATFECIAPNLGSAILKWAIFDTKTLLSKVRIYEDKSHGLFTLLWDGDKTCALTVAELKQAGAKRGTLQQI